LARYQVGIQTEARILEATREMLAEEGLDGATLKAICDRAGVQAGSFYNLFDSKEEAVLRVVSEAIRAVDPDPDGAGTDGVNDLVNAYVAFLTEEPALARIYVQIAISSGTADSAVGSRFLRHHQARVERFADALHRADDKLSAEAATAHAEVLLGALDGLAFRWALDPVFDFAGHAHLATMRFAVSPDARV
jgi:AcrR family transcriptional regulator